MPEQEQLAFMRRLMEPLLQGDEPGLRDFAPCRFLEGLECCLDQLADCSRRGLRVHVAGTPCVDWSRRRKTLGVQGRRAIVRVIWLARVIRAAEFEDDPLDIILHECTPDYPDHMLMDALHHFSSRKWMLEVFRVCP